MAAEDRIGSYADALLAVARAEGSTERIESELFSFGQALRGNDQLRAGLTDATIPVANRVQVIDDLLGHRASPTTTALVSMVVGTGRSRDLPEIIDAMVDKAAATRNKGVARVRSAVELTADQQQRLAQAISRATGIEVEVRVVIDETIMGGIITELGDDIIDGSVRSRLQQMRESFR